VAVAASFSPDSTRRIEAAVQRAASGHRLMLAVSGGRDSMALLHAAARVAPASVAIVATFDHGTGPAATHAAHFVAGVAASLGFAVALGRAAHVGQSEDAWRSERWRFLRDVAGATASVVTTAHTRDDQLETVLMRVLRDTGARGLAGLYAAGETQRPLLDMTRAEINAYVAQRGVAWVDDPTNTSSRFFRNRIRRDILPALLRAQPALQDDLLALARRAAEVRDWMDALACALSQRHHSGRSVSVAAEHLTGYSRAELSMLWPAIAARVGLAMDWRGTERAAAFTTQSRVGARIQLSGGWEIARTRHLFELGRSR
jgi:tRNA(Ile)-lysidine synthase